MRAAARTSDRNQARQGAVAGDDEVPDHSAQAEIVVGHGDEQRGQRAGGCCHLAGGGAQQ